MNEQQRKQKNRSLRHNYNITLDNFEEMLQLQESKCACCKTEKEESDYWEIDHDHSCCPSPRSGVGKTCGKCIRGILCSPCNRMLAWARDSVYRLQSGINYLNKWKEDS